MENKYDLPETQLIIDKDNLLENDSKNDSRSLSDSADSTTILNNGIRISVTCIRNKKSEVINNSVFKIGSSHRADLCIDDNETISRIHAIITLEDDGCFYISDNNSSNHSYFEGVLAKPNTKYRLFSGSRFMLSNEEFIFIIQ